ncbi:NUDIX domain-containing protein [Phreatobacter sp.]|uniref:NUDIX hydrolase n=1 Tax=Phreatobacter sp. TaxID=1966341 RepID=UPI0022C1ECB9|nr:NUDIX domain-containing protein [Phreatobacter sp.]MCZ8316013.1 NUDIX domain-containing protein [Phreatobacter sp.]
MSADRGSVWVPPQVVVVKVLGLARHGDRWLVTEVAGSDGHVAGVRPLGGTIAFGETRDQALHREFREELGCAITIAGPWHAFENLFELGGVVGHEIIFAAEVTLHEGAVPLDAAFTYRESDGTACTAGWYSLADLAARGWALYPPRLSALLAP